MVVRTEESDESSEWDITRGSWSLPCNSKARSVAVWRNVGSYSREVYDGKDVSVAIDLESRGARHCYTSCLV